jgi:hypothetical protein
MAEKLEEKVKITDKPLAPGENAAPAPVTPAKPAAPAKAAVAPKRPKAGRPPGAPNKPKPAAPAGAVEMKARRRAPSQYVDTKAALNRLSEETAEVIKKHNAEHPGDKWELSLIRPGATTPKLSAELCSSVFESGAELLGGAMGVDSRPTDAAVKEVGKKWAEASAYLPEFDPRWMAFGMAIAATFGALAPMIAENKARKMGIIPSGEHIGPHDIAEGKLGGGGTSV